MIGVNGDARRGASRSHRRVPADERPSPSDRPSALVIECWSRTRIDSLLDSRAEAQLEGEAALEGERLENLVSLLRERAAKAKRHHSLARGSRGSRERLGERVASG